MKIFFIDWNNMTPQYTFPLIDSFNNKKEVEPYFISNTQNKDKELSSYYNFNCINIFFPNKHKLLKPIILFFNYCLLLYKIFKIRPVIIQYNWLSIPAIDYIFIKLFKILDITVFLTQHNYIQHNKKYLRFGENLIFNNVDVIICLSSFVKNQFSYSYQKKIFVIPHSNCYEKILKPIKKNLNQIISFLLIGNIQKYKGIEFLIDVMHCLKLKNCKIHLNIYGFGKKDYIDSLNKKIICLNLENMISITNQFSSFDNLCYQISRCDIGLLPYEKASQSGLPYLYAYYKKPMIINNVGGLVEQSCSSFCNISEYNVESFSSSIINMLDKIKNNSMKNSEFEKFLLSNSWDNCINKYFLKYLQYEN